jgi:hypothetical protein
MFMGRKTIGRASAVYLEFRESAVTNEVKRRALAYPSESDTENNMLSIPFLMKAGVVTGVMDRWEPAGS